MEPKKKKIWFEPMTLRDALTSWATGDSMVSKGEMCTWELHLEVTQPNDELAHVNSLTTSHSQIKVYHIILYCWQMKRFFFLVAAI